MSFPFNSGMKSSKSFLLSNILKLSLLLDKTVLKNAFFFETTINLNIILKY